MFPRFYIWEPKQNYITISKNINEASLKKSSFNSQHQITPSEYMYNKLQATQRQQERGDNKI